MELNGSTNINHYNLGFAVEIKMQSKTWPNYFNKIGITYCRSSVLQHASFIKKLRYFTAGLLFQQVDYSKIA